MLGANLASSGARVASGLGFLLQKREPIPKPLMPPVTAIGLAPANKLTCLLMGTGQHRDFHEEQGLAF